MKEYSMKGENRMARTKPSEKWCKYNGLRMTIGQRNILMKSDYIHQNMTPKQIAAKYDVSLSTVQGLVNEGKWVAARKNFLEQAQQKAEGAMITAFAGMQVEVTVNYNDAWMKLMNLIHTMLDNPRQYLMTNTGDVKITRLEAIANIIEKAQIGQEKCVGFVDKHAEVKLGIEQKRLELYAKNMGDEDDDAVTDNFIQALEVACKDVWGDEIINSLDNPVQK